jgi:hypothetical protein
LFEYSEDTTLEILLCIALEYAEIHLMVGVRDVFMGGGVGREGICRGEMSGEMQCWKAWCRVR